MASAGEDRADVAPKGAEFDREYVRSSGVQDHQAAIAI